MTAQRPTPTPTPGMVVQLIGVDDIAHALMRIGSALQDMADALNDIRNTLDNKR